MIFQRKIYKDLLSHLSKKQITVVTGMRRTGKTTLLKQLMADVKSDNKLYLDLERLDNREIFSEKNYENIIKTLSARGLNFSKKTYLFIDEIQLYPEISSILKYLYDNFSIKFIVSGSSSFYLKNLFLESLAGRKKIFELYTLDFGEFLTFNNENWQSTEIDKKEFSSDEFERFQKYYQEYIRFGGFPEVVLAQTHQDKQDLLLDIISSYINIDIKSLADFRQDKDTYNLIKLLAARVGNKLDYSKLSRLAGISRPTLTSYIDFFEKTYLISRISVISKKSDREIVKAQKIYFSDNGFVNILAEVSSGSQFENAVYNQIKHLGKVQYYSLKNGKEIDFILDEKLALEVKESPTEFDLAILSNLAHQIGIKNVKLIGRSPVPKFNEFCWGGSIR